MSASGLERESSKRCRRVTPTTMMIVPRTKASSTKSAVVRDPDEDLARSYDLSTGNRSFEEVVSR